MAGLVPAIPFRNAKPCPTERHAQVGKGRGPDLLFCSLCPLRKKLRPQLGMASHHLGRIGRFGVQFLGCVPGPARIPHCSAREADQVRLARGDNLFCLLVTRDQTDGHGRYAAFLLHLFGKRRPLPGSLFPPASSHHRPSRSRRRAFRAAFAPAIRHAPIRTSRLQNASGSQAIRRIRRCAGWRAATGTDAPDSRERRAIRSRRTRCDRRAWRLPRIRAGTV